MENYAAAAFAGCSALGFPSERRYAVLGASIDARTWPAGDCAFIIWSWSLGLKLERCVTSHGFYLKDSGSGLGLQSEK